MARPKQVVQQLEKLQSDIWARPAMRAIIKAGNSSLLGEAAQEIQKYLLDYRESLLKSFMVYDDEAAAERVDSLSAMPVGTRFLHEQNNRIVVMVETPPQVRTLNFEVEGPHPFRYVQDSDFHTATDWETRIAARQADSQQYHLALPYCVFTAYIKRHTRGRYVGDCFFVNYATAPIVCITNQLYLCNLPNVYNCRVCQSYRGESSTSIAFLVEKAMSIFWQSNFSSDGSVNFERAANMDQRVRSLESWAKATKENPLFPLDVRWERYGNVKRNLTETIAGYRDIANNGDMEHIVHQDGSISGQARQKLDQQLQEACIKAHKEAMKNMETRHMDYAVGRMINKVIGEAIKSLSK